MEAIDYLNIAMRFLHIASMTAIVGGLIFLRLELNEETVRRYRTIFLTAAGGVLISGIYNFLHKTGLTPTYHAIFGIKILLVLHVLAAGYMATRPGNPRRQRQATGALITAILILLLSAVLRKLSS